MKLTIENEDDLIFVSELICCYKDQISKKSHRFNKIVSLVADTLFNDMGIEFVSANYDRKEPKRTFDFNTTKIYEKFNKMEDSELNKLIKKPNYEGI